VPLANAVSVNIGTLDFRKAGDPAPSRPPTGQSGSSIPSGRPTKFSHRISRRSAKCHPAVIRGNASEIISLSGGESSARGVDSTAFAESRVDAAIENRRGSSRSRTTDYVTDGRRTIALIE